MLVVFFRSLILYVVVFLVIRLMGKRELSKVQPFELAIIILIADLAASPMASPGISIFDGIVPIVTLLIAYIIVTFLTKSSNKVQEVICGKVSVIIENGKIVEKELENQQYTIQDIMTQLRQKDVFMIQDVKYAIIETNGDINVIKMDENVKQFPVNIIEDGKISDNNLEIIAWDSSKVDKLLKTQKLKMEDILVGTLDVNGKFLYQLKEVKK